MTYFAIGTNPPSDLANSVEHEIALFLQANYDETITGVPANKVTWEQWFTGSTGDYGIYLEQVMDNDVSTEISGMLQDIDHVTAIHVFARSMHSDYDRSADRVLFKFEQWIKKLISENRTALQSKGIQALYYQNSRNVFPYDDKTDIKRKIISVWSRISLVNY